ncbi:MAG TPA: S41 family peptidase [Stellaceae bacterium]|nr:S41 family peptidase [Stellaceae bacterium]
MMVRAGLARLACAVAAIAPLALAGCGGGKLHESMEGHLFGEVYRDVVSYHVEETGADRLSLAALATLGRIDPALSVERAGGIVVLRHGEQAIRFPAPDAGDIAGWGDLTGEIVAAARAASPEIAGLAPDIADERMIGGALVTLDRYSRYLRPDLASERRAKRDGFVGLGVALDIAADEVRVASVLPDTPAETAGLRVADRIVAVDGAMVASLSADEVHDRLRGPKNSTVTLEIARDGTAGTLTLVMRRAVIVEENVTLERRDGVAWLKVRVFNHRTAKVAAELLHEAHQGKSGALHGIVLDLRDNPGGLLDQSIDLASLFLAGAPVSSTTGRVPDSEQSFSAPRDGMPETAPMAVLINGGSASSAEIVAAALQDARRAVVIGTSSYGKGTVQTVFRTGNGGELTVTWAYLVAPRGYRLDHHGVVPTVCTSGLADDPAAIAERIAAAPGPLGAPREALDEAGWTQLRLSCPPRRRTREIDEAVAARLIDRPALYRAALIGAPFEAQRPVEAHLSH